MRSEAIFASLSLASLALALVAEYGFGLAPCELCLAQRVPYLLVVVLYLLLRWLPALRPYGLLAMAVLFLVDGGIALYHSAVEQHWVAGPSACTSSLTQATHSTEDLLAAIEKAPVVACDQPTWEFHGITMAQMNALWALMLACACVVRKRKQSR